MSILCGHTATGNLGPLVCYLPAGHQGLHAESHRLRDGVVTTTNWGDDGLAPHATRGRDVAPDGRHRSVDGEGDDT